MPRNVCAYLTYGNHNISFCVLLKLSLKDALAGAEIAAMVKCVIEKKKGIAPGVNPKGGMRAGQTWIN